MTSPSEPCISVLADTQVVVWYLLEASRLSKSATYALEAATANGDLIGVAAFSIVELVYATEKPTNPFTTADLEVVLASLGDEEGPFEVVSLDAAIAARVRSIPRVQNADPGDRIIVATAEVLGVPLVSADHKIPTMTAGQVIW